ncbi:MAG: amidohydrolase family protein [Wenzhouxiangella sp.]
MTQTSFARSLAHCLLGVCLASTALANGVDDMPAVWPGEVPENHGGEGPFERLILRGPIMIDGTGAPPSGPVDIVIEGNRIREIRNVAMGGVFVDDSRRPQADENTRELDLSGQYILPGFVDLHGHVGGQGQGVSADYVFRLWLAHGVTSVRDPGSGAGIDWMLDHQQKSADNRILAPRLHVYVTFGRGHDGPITTPDQARQWVRGIAAAGADGIKFFGARPDVLEAAINEAGEVGIGTTMHLAQLHVTRTHMLDAARMGLGSMEHWYGLPESMFTDRRVQDYPHDYNYSDEQDRFAEAGRLWRQAAGPDDPRWHEVRDELIALDFTIVPTLNIYQANRDLMRERTAEWHPLYTKPALWDFFEPSRTAHGSYWFDWTTAIEIDWKDNYRRWMAFLNDYKNHGGRVATGSDSGFIYKTYGFGFVSELELLQEAGFHPLEVIRSATLSGAEALGVDGELGTIEVGKLADLVVVPDNPLQNFKLLYGTGAIRVDADNRVYRAGGVSYTIKDGVIFDAVELRAELREQVRQAWEAEDRVLRQPGLTPD